MTSHSNNGKMSLKIALLSGAAMTLAACGGGGHTSTPPPVTTTTLSLEQSFGTQFGTDFDASANTEPVKPANGDIIALTLTAEPMALHK